MLSQHNFTSFFCAECHDKNWGHACMDNQAGAPTGWAGCLLPTLCRMSSLVISRSLARR